MRDEELYSSGVFASELDDDVGEDIKEPDEIDEDLLDDEDELLDEDEASYNPLDDYNKEEW